MSLIYECGVEIDGKYIGFFIFVSELFYKYLYLWWDLGVGFFLWKKGVIFRLICLKVFW